MDYQFHLHLHHHNSNPIFGGPISTTTAESIAANFSKQQGQIWSIRSNELETISRYNWI